MIIIRHRHGQLSRRSFSPSSPRGAHRLGCFTLGAQRRAIKHLLSSSTPPPPPAPATSTAVAGCRTGFGKKGLLSGGQFQTIPKSKYEPNQTKPSQYDPGIYIYGDTNEVTYGYIPYSPAFFIWFFTRLAIGLLSATEQTWRLHTRLLQHARTR
jgi:hypothetical protein